VGAALLAAGVSARGQEAKPGEPEPAPGKRLVVQLQETRQRGESTTSSRPSRVLLHADGGQAYLFVGTQAPMTLNESSVPTTQFKNVGLTASIGVKSLADGRYAVEAEFEASQRRRLPTSPGDAPVTGGNPILQTVKSRSRLTLREGETVPFASAVDPVSGDVVNIDLTLSAAPAPKPAATAGGDGSRLRARVVVVRKQGETIAARRPYSVTVQPGEERAEVFSGSQLPVQTRMNNSTTVALKDVGAGLKLKALRNPDGRYRLDVEFRDGVLVQGDGAPQLRTFESASRLVLQAGESVTLASAVDPQTGESVEAELTIEGVK
jgi:hypothetical protein